MTPEEIAAEIVKKSRNELVGDCGCERSNGRRTWCMYHDGMEDGHEFLLAALRQAGYRIVRQREWTAFDLMNLQPWADVEDGAR